VATLMRSLRRRGHRSRGYGGCHAVDLPASGKSTATLLRCCDPRVSEGSVVLYGRARGPVRHPT